MDPGTIALAISAASAATGAAVSAAEASARNRQTREAAEQQALEYRRAAGVQMKQVSEQASLEKARRLNEARLIASRLRVAAGESGLGYGGSYQAMLRQLDYDLALNRYILSRNRQNRLRAIAAGAASQISGLSVPEELPWLAGLTGGLRGAQIGLNLFASGLTVSEMLSPGGSRSGRQASKG